jgi:PAS domain S-box-containing protein
MMEIGLIEREQPALSDARFRLLVESIGDYAIFMLDPAGYIVSWNKGAERIKGYRASEIVGRHFSCFYSPESVEQGLPAHELSVAATQGRFEDEGWRVRKDGSKFWASVSITAMYEHGKLCGFAKITRDLSERREHEEALRRSEERFRLMVEGVKDYAIFMLDSTGHIMSWNAGAQRIKGYRAEEIIGRHFSCFYEQASIDSGWPARELEMAKLDGRFEDVGWRVRKDGSKFWANVVITALTDEHGKFYGFAKVTRDLSEQRRAQALQHSERRMREFVSIIAHELRNPLAAIKNGVELLQHSSKLEHVHAATEILGRQTGQLNNLIDDLLDADRISSGRVKLKFEQVDLKAILRTALESVQPLFDARRHQVTLDLPEAPLLVEGDAVRLIQVFANILHNAAKFTPPGGHIDYTARLKDGGVQICIRDNGIGIPIDLLPEVFHMFRQGNVSLDRTEAGLGIGLSLASGLVTMHNGNLRAFSEGSGRGSEFAVWLPLAVAAPAEAAPPR